MNTPRPLGLVWFAALCLTCISADSSHQDRAGRAKPGEEYRVVMSNSMRAKRAWKAEDKFTDIPELTQVLNALAREGWSTIQVLPMPASAEDIPDHVQFMAVAKR